MPPWRRRYAPDAARNGLCPWAGVIDLRIDMMTPEPSPRQRLTYLPSLMDSRHIRPKNKLGQNLLIDLNLLSLIVRAAELSREDLVLEVGSGTGGLTTRLAEQAGAVLSVEIDSDFFELAR